MLFRPYTVEPGYIESDGDHKIVRYIRNAKCQIKSLVKNIQGDFTAFRYTQ